MLFGADDSGKPATSEHDIVKEAAYRYKAAKDWQGLEDINAAEDRKYANADARNMWQWPQKQFKLRDDKSLPCLTINKVRGHNDMIINSMMKTPYAVKIRPTAGKASYKAAEMYQKLVRRTQDISAFPSQARKIAEHQVDGGIGYLLLETRYVSERSFDQDIYLTVGEDPGGILLDPWAREPDKSDSNFGFIFRRFPKHEFNRKYPDFKDKIGQAPIESGLVDWLTDKEVMVVKYYRKSEKADTLVAYTDENGVEVEKLASELKDEAGRDLFKMLMEDIKEGRIDGRTRKVGNPKVEWFLIGGDVIIDRGVWPGKFIPICPAIGREIVVDGQLDRKGHTRPLIDAQRMLNYGASGGVQAVALGVLSQWLADSRATEGQEQWKDANVQTYGVLQYTGVDEEGEGETQIIPPPTRIPPVDVPQAHMSVAASAERQMMMISGQFQAQMGEEDQQSAASGKAIGERQQQGDTATHHFPDNFAAMLRYAGRQLIDLYPKIYDTKRALHITGDDGEKFWIQIDPNQQDDLIELQREKDDEEATRLAFNPKLGEFEVVSDPGPDYATQRQEAWAAYSLILQQNMALAGVIGDLIFKYGDFPGADDIAERLEKEIKATKPYLFDPTKEPALAAATQQLQKLTALNAELMQKLAMKDLQIKGRDERRDVEASNAETKRLQVIVDAMAKLGLPAGEQARMEHELGLRLHDHVLDNITMANQGDIDMQVNSAMPKPSTNGSGA